MTVVPRRAGQNPRPVEVRRATSSHARYRFQDRKERPRQRRRPRDREQLVEHHIDQRHHGCRHRNDDLPRFAPFDRMKEMMKIGTVGIRPISAMTGGEPGHPAKKQKAAREDDLAGQMRGLRSDIHVDFLRLARRPRRRRRAHAGRTRR